MDDCAICGDELWTEGGSLICASCEEDRYASRCDSEYEKARQEELDERTERAG